MIKKISLQVTPENSDNKSYLIKNIANRLSIKSKNIDHIEIIKRSIDARRKIIKINLIVNVYINQKFKPKNDNHIKYQDVSQKEKVIINGKEYETDHFKLTSKDMTLPDDKRLNFDIWLDKKTSLIVKVTYQRMGNWEYRLKNYE